MFVPFVFSMSTINTAPYLWWFYKGLDFIKKTHSAMIAQEIYCNTPVSVFAAEGRAEAFQKQTGARLQYDLPKNSDLKRQRLYPIPDSLVASIISEKGSITDAFCYLLGNSDRSMCNFLSNLIDRIEKECGEKIEAFFTLIAIPSLTEVAHTRGIPVIHFELGCLRDPTYLATAFWDLQDTQGGDTVETRWKLFCDEGKKRKIPLFSKRETLAILMRQEKLGLLREYGRKPEKQAGAILGYTTYELLSYRTHLNDSEMLFRMKEKYGLENMLVRKHPGDPYGGQYPKFAAAMDDRRKTMPEFLLDCETVVSLISGACFEAMLWGRKAITVLPSPSYYASGHEIEGEGKCAGEDFTSFFAFGYLIPLDYLMDVDYLRWRLSGPSEREIYFKHLEFYFKKKGISTDLLFGEPGSRLDKILSAQGFKLEEGK